MLRPKMTRTGPGDVSEERGGGCAIARQVTCGGCCCCERAPGRLNGLLPRGPRGLVAAEWICCKRCRNCSAGAVVNISVQSGCQ